MAEDHIITGSLAKRLMDFVGKQAAAADPKIPDDQLPDYSRHGPNPRFRVSDGDSLEEAIYNLDIPWDLTIASASSGGMASALINATRSQQVLILARVSRYTNRTVTVSDSFNVTVYGGSNDPSMSGTASFSTSVNTWTTERSGFTLYHGATPIGSQNILQPDGEAVIFAQRSIAAGANTFSLSHTSGPLGTLTGSEILVVGTYIF